MGHKLFTFSSKKVGKMSTLLHVVKPPQLTRCHKILKK